MVRKRGDGNEARWYVRLSIQGKPVEVVTPATGKREAESIEASLKFALRTQKWSAIDETCQDIIVRMCKNRGWPVPAELTTGNDFNPHDHVVTPDNLTLWKAVELTIKYPDIKNSADRPRKEMAFAHFVQYFGRDALIKNIRVPQLKQYRVDRQDPAVPKGKKEPIIATSATVNREMASLSKLFHVLMEMDLTESNPVRMIKPLSTRSGERQIYLGKSDVIRIIEKAPDWAQPIVWTAFYSGMRRGEILEIKRNQIDLAKRIISLSPDDTKETGWKRVPIHKDLVGILRTAMSVPLVGSECVFLIRDEHGVRPVLETSFKNVWARSCRILGLTKPWPRLHDLRHTWKTNARRSGVDAEIRERILGHSAKQLTVVERYGYISDDELVREIDKMTFDHGETVMMLRSRQE